MGRRGPPPKPTKLRVLQGNPSHRPLNRDEPKPASGLPRCPDWLPETAKAEWRRVARLLRALGVLTRVDADALTVYCQTYARWRAAEEFLAKHGEVYPLRDENGRVRYMQQFPQVSIARHLAQLVRAYQQEFGMTPSSRSRVRVEEGKGPSALEQFLGRKKA